MQGLFTGFAGQTRPHNSKTRIMSKNLAAYEDAAPQLVLNVPVSNWGSYIEVKNPTPLTRSRLSYPTRLYEQSRTAFYSQAITALPLWHPTHFSFILLYFSIAICIKIELLRKNLV